MLYSFISHKAKEVEEMFLAESKNLTVRDFQTVVSEFGFFSCAVAMDPLKSEALTRACTSLTWPMQRRFHRLVYIFYHFEVLFLRKWKHCSVCVRIHYAFAQFVNDKK